MPTIDETGLRGKIRDRPINDRLRSVLLLAAEDAAVDVVAIFSGGQPGSTGRRTGSTRHDGGNAADLKLIKDGRTLRFTDRGDLPTFEAFVTAAAAHGATGMGAGVTYMGPESLHVGFGRSPADTSRVVWGGASKRSAEAPDWLRRAAERGWAGGHAADAHASADTSDDEGAMQIASDEVERFRHLLDFIAFHEGTDRKAGRGYDTSLDYGIWLPGRVETTLTAKSLDEIDALQTGMLANPGNRAKYGSGTARGSSALGRYQIVRSTLRALRRTLGLDGGRLFSAALQDLLAVALIKECGPDARKLANQWASLKTVSPAEILRAYDARSEVQVGDPLNPDVLDLLRRLDRHLDTRDSAASWVDADWGMTELKTGARGEAVERLQTMLTALKYPVGRIDGKFGVLTRDAVAAFQLSNDLPGTGIADARTWAVLATASPRPLPAERLTTDAQALRSMGSVEIQNADRTRYAGWLTGALGALGLTKSGAEALTAPAAPAVSPDSLIRTLGGIRQAIAGAPAPDPKLSQAIDLIQQTLAGAQQAPQAAAAKVAGQAALGTVGSLVETALPLLSYVVPGPAGSLLAIGLGFLFNRFGNNIIERRVAAHRDARNISVVGS